MNDSLSFLFKGKDGRRTRNSLKSHLFDERERKSGFTVDDCVDKSITWRLDNYRFLETLLSNGKYCGNYYR